MQEIKQEIYKIEGGFIKSIKPGSLNSSIIQIIIENAESEEVLLMVYCSWRLSQENKILTSWNDDYSSTDTNYYKQLMSITGQIINSIQINHLNDIFLSFNNKELHVFSDLYTLTIETKTENWDFCIPNKNLSYSVLSNNELIKEDYY